MQQPRITLCPGLAQIALYLAATLANPAPDDEATANGERLALASAARDLASGLEAAAERLNGAPGRRTWSACAWPVASVGQSGHGVFGLASGNAAEPAASAMPARRA